MARDDSGGTPQRALAVRLGIGLSQGLALYALSRWHARIVPTAFEALALTALLAPVVALGAWGAARRGV